MRKIIVYDSDHPGAKLNRCFAKSYADEGPGHNFTVGLAEEAASRGIEAMTADVYLDGQHGHHLAFLVTDMESSNTDRLIRLGAIPFLNYCNESPLIARQFYINIRKKTGKFAYSMQFRGTAERLKRTQTHFEVMYFPVGSRAQLPMLPWNSKKYMILVNRNKRIFRTDYSNLKSSLHSALSRINLSYQRLIDPWMRSREIYTERVEMIKYFSRYDFELYGIGWENRIVGFSQSYQEAAKKVFKGQLGNKLAKMSEFKFTICFENCSFPGYITEKIFDSFLSGCIPIYLGAPDITDFVPADTFIDYRKFSDPEELNKYLGGISEEEGTRMIRSAGTFLASQDFDRFYLKNIVRGIVDKIEKYPVVHHSV